MDVILVYLVKSFICSGILTGFYWLFLRNKNFHTYNRFYLLLAIVFNLLQPLMVISFPKLANVSFLNLSKDYLPHDIDFKNEVFFLFLASVAVSLVLLLRILLNVYRLYEIKRRFRVIKMAGFNLVETDLNEAPFTFLDNLFWRNGFSMDDDSGKKIWMHEITHIRERHSFDKLFSQFIVAIFWLNPFFRIMQRELNMVHEFIADESCIDHGDTESFAKMVLLAGDGSSYMHEPFHGFFHSPVQRRLKMIEANHNNKMLHWRKILVIPVIFWLTVFISSTVTDSYNGHEQKLKDERASLHKQINAAKQNAQQQLPHKSP